MFKYLPYLMLIFPIITHAQTASFICNNGRVDSTCIKTTFQTYNILSPCTNPYACGTGGSSNPGSPNSTGGNTGGDNSPPSSSGSTNPNEPQEPCNTPIDISADTTLITPNQCPNVLINWAIAGGGSGGDGEQQSNGGSGGGGGSGGYVENSHIASTRGSTVSITVGKGGVDLIGQGGYVASPQDGTSTIISVNGGNNIVLSPGKAGTSGLDADNAYIVYGIARNVAGVGGAGGSPNGNTGENGALGASPKTGHGASVGGNGADSPKGMGGAGGIPKANVDGGNATGYGAGGGGGSNDDGSKTRGLWYGGSGSNGHVNIEFVP